jgi:copper chaperone CopZ
MDTLTLDLPAMYGDHHVTEVRRLLSEMPGVEDVYASSAFQVVEVAFDPKKVKPDAIKAALGEAGYLEELAVPVETGVATYWEEGHDTFFRHTASYEQTKEVVGFAQSVSYSGRPLWPCPGMGVIQTQASEE